MWLYVPRLSREMLFAVVREAEQCQRLAEQRIATWQREYDDGGAGRTIVALTKELDAEQKLARSASSSGRRRSAASRSRPPTRSSACSGCAS